MGSEIFTTRGFNMVGWELSTNVIPRPLCRPEQSLRVYDLIDDLNGDLNAELVRRMFEVEDTEHILSLPINKRCLSDIQYRWLKKIDFLVLTPRFDWGTWAMPWFGLIGLTNITGPGGFIFGVSIYDEGK